MNYTATELDGQTIMRDAEVRVKALEIISDRRTTVVRALVGVAALTAGILIPHQLAIPWASKIALAATFASVPVLAVELGLMHKRLHAVMDLLLINEKEKR